LTLDDDVIVSAKLSPATRKTLEDLMTHQIQLQQDSTPKIQEISEQHCLPSTTICIHHHSAQTPELVQSKSAGGAHEVNIVEDGERLDQKPEAAAWEPCVQSAPEDISHKSAQRTSIHTLEITLRNDSEFFNMLTDELKQIDRLQSEQKAHLTTHVVNLGKGVLAVARPGGPRSSSDLYAWREIFSLYRDAAVFFATKERDHGSRTAEEAKGRIQWFQNEAQNGSLVSDPDDCCLISDAQVQE
jgi:SPX domain